MRGVSGGNLCGCPNFYLMQVISRCFSDAWNRTGYLLFERFRFRRWVSYATLHMLGGSAGSAGYMPPIPGTTTSEKSLLVLGAAAGLSLPPEALWALAAAALFGLVIMLGLAWLSSVAKVVLIENIVHDRDALSEPMARLGGLGTSVFGWTLISGGVLLGAAVAMLYGLAPTPPDPKTAPTEVLNYALTIMGLVVPLLMAMVTLNLVTNEVVVPVMYHGNLGALAALGRTAGMVASRPLPWLGWLFARMLIGMATGCMESIMGCIVLVLLLLVIGAPSLVLGLALQSEAAVLGIGVVAALVFVLVLIPAMLAIATPFTVLTRCFTLYWLQANVDELQMLPLGGRGTLGDETAPAPVGFTPC